MLLLWITIGRPTYSSKWCTFYTHCYLGCLTCAEILVMLSKRSLTKNTLLLLSVSSCPFYCVLFVCYLLFPLLPLPWCSGWLSPEDDPLGYVDRIDRRIEAITGLAMSTAEQLQASSYLTPSNEGVVKFDRTCETVCLI